MWLATLDGLETIIQFNDSLKLELFDSKHAKEWHSKPGQAWLLRISPFNLSYRNAQWICQ
ncbi:MAG: hypothetical protein CMI66_14025 [Pedosphaera sp.]|nr:hypothetical protein [Pedosphaera sp.]HBP55537.1 hypothetical protein [Verrucomicrobiales bacterium]HCZ04548.1 hypothetical protein [Verrucomicrobiales bacterium]